MELGSRQGGGKPGSSALRVRSSRAPSRDADRRCLDFARHDRHKVRTICSGRTVTIADQPVPTQPRRRLADDLRAAIAAGEIELRFQPQVELAGGAIAGVEVLARWRHRRLGELGAERLFGAAARAKLLPELSRHIHAVALRQVGAWPAALAHLTVAVNVTAADLARADFAGDLLAQVQAYRIDPARLTVEITEHDLIANLESAAEKLSTLRAAGMAVALDDFGTGYSSISYLKALPLDYIKIDGRLSLDLLGDAREQVVVRHVIAIARELGLGLIAEGVETEQHRALLAAAGATHFQGFLCSGPVEVGEVARLVDL